MIALLSGRRPEALLPSPSRGTEMAQPKQKPLYLLKRLASLTQAQFTDHWLNVHAALLRSIPEWSRLRSGYVQNHLIGSGLIGDWTFPYDGVTQVFVRPGTEGGPAFPQLPVFHDKVVPDELSFLDRERVIVLKTLEHIVLPGSAAVKVIVFHRRYPGTTLESFIEHWQGAHKDRLLEQVDFTQEIRGYRQNPLIAGESRYLSGEPLEASEDFDGASEFWFDTVNAAVTAFASRGFKVAIRDDPTGHFSIRREYACLVNPVIILPE
ncbi:hypothetical protein FSB78_18540 [Sphingomonas ginsenosidivorax]|uniref:EthD domain-containing protein n=1 Tax=Sphingomonas ginsenosidivorax TaxID=862135 RepID=A0A5C6U526_9SPHN|nr:EthD domain-containing protein [Sphingomonas ginsenosidivorax]TXC67984.1 hypothetical protein FSB78_18540 [Sphingomonas ginsenosidivorax]